MLKVIDDSHKELRNKSIDVEIPLTKEDRDLVLAMLDYVKQSQDSAFAKKNHIREGVGLAAPQLGINKKLIAIYYPISETEVVSHALANPRIVSNSVRKAYIESGEGCLSVNKEHKGYVIRDFKITVRAFDAIENKEVEFVAKGYDAIVLQHEIDHLNGILFYDRINKKDPFAKIEGAFVI